MNTTTEHTRTTGSQTKKIRQILYPILIACFFGILLVCIFFFVSASRSSLQHQSFADLLQTSLIIENAIKESGDFTQARSSTLQERLARLVAGSDTRISVILEQGEVIVDTEKDPSLLNNHSARPEIHQAFADGQAHAILRHSATLGMDMLYLARLISVIDQNERQVEVVLRVAMPYTALKAAYRTLTMYIVISVGLIIVIALLLIYAFQRWIERPLEEVADIATRFARLEFREIGPYHSMPQELDRVYVALREMSRQLQSQFDDVQRQRDELQAVLDCMDEAVVIIDRNGLILKTNPSAQHLLTPRSSTSLPGKLYNQFIQDSELAKNIESILDQLQDEHRDVPALEGPLRLSTEKTGKVDISIGSGKFQVYAVLVNRSPEPIILLVLHDITTLMHLEQVRKDFVANVSHELKTPITSIKGFSETLIQGDLLPDDPRFTRFLRIIHSQTERLQSIIDDLLTLSMLDQKHQRLEDFVEVEALSIITESVKICSEKPLTQDRPIHIRCDSGIMIRCNAVLIEQALVNLIDNAMKYSDPSTPVTLV